MRNVQILTDHPLFPKLFIPNSNELESMWDILIPASCCEYLINSLVGSRDSGIDRLGDTMNLRPAGTYSIKLEQIYRLKIGFQTPIYQNCNYKMKRLLSYSRIKYSQMKMILLL